MVGINNLQNVKEDGANELQAHYLLGHTSLFAKRSYQTYCHLPHQRRAMAAVHLVTPVNNARGCCCYFEEIKCVFTAIPLPHKKKPPTSGR